MRILSINDSNTANDSRIALDVDETPDPATLALVEHSEISASFSDGLLYIESTINGLPILSRHIDDFLASYKLAQQRVSKKESDARAKHKNLLNEISKRLGIPIGQ